MKPLIISFILLATCFSVSTCKKKKKGKLIINSFVYEPATGNTVADATVRVYVQKIEGSTYQAFYTYEKEVTTNAQGLFYFEMDYDLVVKYRLEISKPGYFTEHHFVASEHTPINEPYATAFSIYPEAWLRLNIKTQAADNVVVTRVADHPSCVSCCNDTAEVFIGNNYETSTLCKTYGDMRVAIDADFGVGTSEVDKNYYVTTKSFDTTTVEITYY